MKYVIPLVRSGIPDDTFSNLQGSLEARGLLFQEAIGNSEMDFRKIDFSEICEWHCDRLQQSIAHCTEVCGSAGRIAILVDVLEVSKEKFNLISETPCWEKLIAVLIMSFPEVNWFFGAMHFEEISDNKERQKQRPSDQLFAILENHSIHNLISTPWQCALFDQTGLRNQLRARDCDAFDRNIEQGIFSFSQRKSFAICIDDEYDYALFHALACYRFGYRSATVTNFSQMSAYFKEEGLFSEAKFDLLFEDMSLNFYDKPRGVHLIDFEERAEEFPRLGVENTKGVHRVLVTTGQSKVGDTEGLEKNCHYLGIGADDSTGREKVLKPSGGLIDLWLSAGLMATNKNDGNREITQRSGNPPGFIWPPDYARSRTSQNRPSGDTIAPHGALGGHGVAIHLMLRRAKYLKARAHSIQDQTVVCVLATDAGEILEGKSMHLATEALLLKHEMEVQIECQFNGIGYHIDAVRRKDEIVLECNTFSKWVHPKKRQQFSQNSRLHILSRLADIYLKGGLFEEYELCLKEVRRLNRILVGLDIKSKSGLIKCSQNSDDPLIEVTSRGLANAIRSGWQLFENAILNYSEKALQSVGRLLMLIVLWLVDFTVVWHLIWGKPCEGLSGLLQSYEVVAAAFWEYNVATSNPMQALFSTFVVFVALGHLGLLVAYLYSLVSRR